MRVGEMVRSKTSLVIPTSRDYQVDSLPRGRSFHIRFISTYYAPVCGQCYLGMFHSFNGITSMVILGFKHSVGILVSRFAIA